MQDAERKRHFPEGGLSESKQKVNFPASDFLDMCSYQGTYITDRYFVAVHVDGETKPMNGIPFRTGSSCRSSGFYFQLNICFDRMLRVYTG